MDSIKLTLHTGKIPLDRSNGFAYTLCQHDFRIILTYVFIYQHFFHWRVETGLKHDFIMYASFEGHDLWRLSIVLSTCHNWELLITYPHRPICFKKIRTTTIGVLLISNTVVPNPCSHSAAFDPQSFASLS